MAIQDRETLGRVLALWAKTFWRRREITLGWPGPRDEELTEGDTMLRHPVPPERWPYGPPDWHDDPACTLHQGGLFCDCGASDGGEE